MGGGILIAGVFFAAAGFVATMLGEGPGGTARRSVLIGAVRMILTIACGVTGAFAASRAVPAYGVIAAAAVMAALAGVIYGEVAGKPMSLYVVIVPLVLVVIGAAYDSAWLAIGYGIIAAVPFGISAVLYPRPSAPSDALFCALAGAMLDVKPAFLVMFVASLAAIGVARWKRLPATAVHFAPYVAACTIVAILTTFALVV